MIVTKWSHLLLANGAELIDAAIDALEVTTPNTGTQMSCAVLGDIPGGCPRVYSTTHNPEQNCPEVIAIEQGLADGATSIPVILLLVHFSQEISESTQPNNIIRQLFSNNCVQRLKEYSKLEIPVIKNDTIIVIDLHLDQINETRPRGFKQIIITFSELLELFP